MNEGKLDRLFGQIRRLRLAEADMDMALAAARHLDALDGPLTPIDRAIEAGMVVSYARPFSQNGIGSLDDGWGPPSGGDFQLHEILLNLRDKMYAHSDAPWRGVGDVGDETGPSYAEAYHTIDVYVDYGTVARLTEAMRLRFADAADGVEALLREARPPDAWRAERAFPPVAGPLEAY